MFPPPLVGDIVNTSPLQTDGLMLLIAGAGFTVTVTVNGLPAQEPAVPEVGVTVYVAVCGTLVGFESISVMEDCPVWEVPPVIPPVTTGAGQA